MGLSRVFLMASRALPDGRLPEEMDLADVAEFYRAVLSGAPTRAVCKSFRL